jgi:hypothetical protein
VVALVESLPANSRAELMKARVVSAVELAAQPHQHVCRQSAQTGEEGSLASARRRGRGGRAGTASAQGGEQRQEE